MSQWVMATKVAGRELLVFLKHARPGAAKTRLVPALGAAHAAELYRTLAEAVLEATVPRPGEYERQVFYDPPEAAEAMRSWLPGMRLIRQGAGDLGARMEAAFSRSFRRGARRVALIGTDTPGLTREIVIAALDALDDVDVVLGPAEDGGYYLLALRRPHPELFAGVVWSTAAVLEGTRVRAAAAGLSVRELERHRDVDTLEDLRAEWPRLRGLLAGRPSLLEQAERALGTRGSRRPAAG